MSPSDSFLVTILLSLTVFFATNVFLSRGLATSDLVRGVLHRFSLSSRTCDRVFILSVSLYTLVFAATSILRYLSFNAASDLGLYDQLVWNSLHGRLLQNTLLVDAPFYLGKSFSPVLLAFVPLYAVWRDPSVLLLMQTLALGAGGVPIYWFARERLGCALAVVIGWAYLLFPAVSSINLIDVHGIAFALPMLALATYFLLHFHYRGLLVSLGVAVLIREEIGLIVIMFGVYIFLFQRQHWLGLALSAFGGILTVALLTVVIPSFRGPEYGPEFYYFGSGTTSDAASRYTYLGRNIPEILTTILTQPWIILQHVLIPEKIEFVLHLLIPLAFLPLIGFEASILALPTLGYSLLSNFSFQYSIHSFYHAPMVPFLFYGTILGLERIVRWKDMQPASRRIVARTTWKFALGSTLFAATILSYYFVAPGPFALNFRHERLALDQHTSIANQMIATIPTDATVAAQTEFVAHLSARKFIYDFPGFPDYRQIDYLVADAARPWYSFHKSSWEEILATGYFEVVAQNDGVMVATRRPIARPLDFRFSDQLTLVGVTMTPDGPLRGGMTFRPIAQWRAEKNIVTKYWVEIQVEDAQGHVWAREDREPQEGNLPTNKWKVGEIVGDQYTLKLPVTMPGGDYQLTIALHEEGEEDFLSAFDGQGDLLRNPVVVASFPVQKDKSSVLASQLPIEQPLFIDMQEMRFVGYNMRHRSVRAGERFHLGIYWRARAKPNGDYTVAVQLREQNGRVVFEQSSQPANNTYPTNLWSEGEVLLDWHDFNLPKDIPPNDYELFVLLRDDMTIRSLGEANLGTITITR